MPNNLSLKTALLLRDAGWPQGGLMLGWGYHGDCLMLDTLNSFTEKDNSGDVPCAAPTTDELLAALPHGTCLTKFESRFHADWHGKGLLLFRNESSPVEALASLWLALRKEKII